MKPCHGESVPRMPPCRSLPALHCALPVIKQQAEEAPMQRTKPPFRADEVGSLLRSAPIKEARARRDQSAITADQLREVEDREIEKIIKRQEEVGLKLATDGEFRRSWSHFRFFW